MVRSDLFRSDWVRSDRVRNDRVKNDSELEMIVNECIHIVKQIF